jgi:hypothetical protein
MAQSYRKHTYLLLTANRTSMCDFDSVMTRVPAMINTVGERSSQREQRIDSPTSSDSTNIFIDLFKYLQNIQNT